MSKVAHGVRGLRRQRVGGYTTKTVNTPLHGVRFYEPLRRLLAGRVDFNKFLNDVSKSIMQDKLMDIYTCFAGVTADDLGGDIFFPSAGTYNEDTLLDIIDHVEAASGKPAVIIGTAKVLRNLAPSVQGTDSKSDLYNLGVYGKFYGRQTLCVPQRHRVGTTDFIFPNDVIHVVATDSKPIKMVDEGVSLIKQTDALDNADMTQEYEYYTAYGTAFVAGGNDGIGRYQITG